MIWKKYDVRVVREAYARGGTCLRLVGAGGEDEGMPIATATSWVEGLDVGEVAVKDYSENSGMLDFLLDVGVVEPPHRTLGNGLVVFPVCMLVSEQEGDKG